MPITLTPAAQEAMRNALARRQHGQGIRLCIRHGGCAGQHCWLEFADTQAEDEISFDFGDIRLFAALPLLPYLNDLEIDYLRQGDEEGFQIRSQSDDCQDCGCSS